MNLIKTINSVTIIKIKQRVKSIFKIICNIVLIKFFLSTIYTYTMQIMYPNKTFQFSKYSTSQELEAAIRRRFPIDGEIKNYVWNVVDNLQNSGAKCNIETFEMVDQQNPKLELVCRYQNYISLHPTKIYKIVMNISKNSEIVNYEAWIINDLLWP